MPEQQIDLNDPNAHVSRADAMKMMAQKRREQVAPELYPNDAAAQEAYLNAPRTEPAQRGNGAAVADDEDTDPADRIAEQERQRLLTESMRQSGESAAAVVAASQVDAQRGEEIVIDEADLGKYRVKTKVNGQEQLRSLDEVRSGFQKTEAADVYLAQAKTLLAEVQQTVATATAKGAPTEGVETKPSGEQAEEVSKLIQEATDALLQGDDATYKERMTKVVMQGRGNATQAPTLTDAQVRQIEQRIVTRSALDSALEQFATDHPTIAKNEVLRAQADKFLFEATGGKALEEFPASKIKQLVDEAGTRTEAWVREITGAPAAQARPTTSQGEKRQQRKAQIDEVQTAGARATSTVDQPKTRTDVINDMRKSRGQLVLP